MCWHHEERKPAVDICRLCSSEELLNTTPQPSVPRISAKCCICISLQHECSNRPGAVEEGGLCLAVFVLAELAVTARIPNALDLRVIFQILLNLASNLPGESNIFKYKEIYLNNVRNTGYWLHKIIIVRYFSQS